MKPTPWAIDAAKLIATVEVVISKDRRINLEFDLPQDCPTGAATVTLTFKPQEVVAVPTAGRLAEVYGRGQGLIQMAEDFDAPLADFAEFR